MACDFHSFWSGGCQINRKSKAVKKYTAIDVALIKANAGHPR